MALHFGSALGCELGTMWDVGSNHVPLSARQAVPSILSFNLSLPIIDLFIEMNTEYFVDLDHMY